MTLQRSMVMIFLVCFVSVWSMDTPVANAAGKRARWRKCIEEREQKCLARYDKCPEKEQDALFKMTTWESLNFKKKMKKLGKISEVCFKKLAVCTN